MDKHGVIARSYAQARGLCDEALAAVGEDIPLRSIIETVIQRSH